MSRKQLKIMNSKNPYILVVEDSPDIREQIGKVFRSEGYHVQLMNDGQNALQHLKVCEKMPSVILLDLMMPGMDGFQFRAEQERDARMAGIPVLVMTADANADIKALKIGAQGYLRKPIAVETLIKVAEKFCH